MLEFQDGRSTPSSYPQAVLADNGNTLLISAYSYNFVSQRAVHGRILEYNISSGLVTALAGDIEVSDDFCADGTPLATCTVPSSVRLTSASWSPSRDGWLLHAHGSVRVVIMDGSALLTTLGVFPDPVVAVAHEPLSDATLIACTENGALVKMDQDTSEVTLVDLGSPTIRCDGPVDINEGMLSFVFVQNGLKGIAEMPLP